MRSRARSAHVDGTLSQMNEERARSLNTLMRIRGKHPPSPPLPPFFLTRPPMHTHTRVRAHTSGTLIVSVPPLSLTARLSALTRTSRSRARVGVVVHRPPPAICSTTPTPCPLTGRLQGARGSPVGEGEDCVLRECARARVWVAAAAF